jgi:6-phosphogluconolactonase
MENQVYISLAGNDRLLHFTLDETSGQLSQIGVYDVPGRPAPLAMSPSNRILYVGCRDTCKLSAYKRDPNSGQLTFQESVSVPSDPCYIATDRSGRFLLSAYYQAGHIAIHALDSRRIPTHPPVEWLATGHGAHAIQTDPSNRFAFVPHIAGPKGPNVILQFFFNADTGHLRPNSPPRVVPPPETGPRHYCFHSQLPILYFSNEQGCSVTAYRLNTEQGYLTPFQTISTLPPNFTDQNTCAQIRISPDARFLYAPNRGANTIAGFTINPVNGRLTLINWTPAEPVPRAINIDRQGTFLFAAGLESGTLTTYRINTSNGRLLPLSTFKIGKEPMWILLVKSSKT